MDMESFQKLDIIIVNWNTGTQLRECLRSINKACKIESSVLLRSVIVVDNASTDNSLDIVAQIDLPLTIIRNSKNIGFAAACNLGTNNSDADYFLFLNPDTMLFSNSLIEPITFMENSQNSYIGICGIKLLGDNGEVVVSCARFPTFRVMMGKLTGLSMVIPSVFPAHFMSLEELGNSGEVDQVIGAYFLVRKSLFKKLHGFDDIYFVYYEEVDLSLRAKKMGYASYFLSNVNAYHKGGGSSHQVKAERLFYSLRSRILYGFKHFSILQAVILLVVTVVPEFVSRSLFSLVRGAWQDLRHTVRGYSMLINDMPAIIRAFLKILHEKNLDCR